MHIEFIPGEYSDKGRALCYKYLKEKYIREKVNNDNGNTDNKTNDNDSNLCEGFDRRTSQAWL